MPEKSKKQPKVTLREVKPKGGKFPLSVPRVKYPHDELNRGNEPVLEIVPPTDSLLESQLSTDDQDNTDSQPSTVSTVSQPSTPSTVSTTSLSNLINSEERKILPVAPERDFQKVANSVVRKVAQGVFSGKSKQMYDYLYSLTRGAIIPKRTIRISKPKLMRGTGIGSPQTFYRNINHLESVGLIKRTEIPGEWGGNEYEVFLPEEINLKSVQSVHPVQSVKSAQKQVLLVVPETELTIPSSASINTGGAETSKTYFKDLLNIDDEKPILKSLEILNAAAVAATGSNLTQNEIDALPELFKIIIEETSLARIRTNSVTNYLKFAAENLKRRLAANPRIFTTKEKPFARGIDNDDKNESLELLTNELEPLGDVARKNALVIYRPIFNEQGIEALENVRGNLTKEDWEWLVEKLKEH
jgi:hypothetical protein